MSCGSWKLSVNVNSSEHQTKGYQSEHNSGMVTYTCRPGGFMTPHDNPCITFCCEWDLFTCYERPHTWDKRCILVVTKKTCKFLLIFMSKRELLHFLHCDKIIIFVALMEEAWLKMNTFQDDWRPTTWIEELTQIGKILIAEKNFFC